MRIPTPTLGIPTAASYREVTATRLAGLFTLSLTGMREILTRAGDPIIAVRSSLDAQAHLLYPIASVPMLAPSGDGAFRNGTRGRLSR